MESRTTYYWRGHGILGVLLGTMYYSANAMLITGISLCLLWSMVALTHPRDAS
jgi:hypothetical protein